MPSSNSTHTQSYVHSHGWPPRDTLSGVQLLGPGMKKQLFTLKKFPKAAAKFPRELDVRKENVFHGSGVASVHQSAPPQHDLFKELEAPSRDLVQPPAQLKSY